MEITGYPISPNDDPSSFFNPDYFDPLSPGVTTSTEETTCLQQENISLQKQLSKSKREFEESQIQLQKCQEENRLLKEQLVEQSSSLTVHQNLDSGVSVPPPNFRQELPGIAPLLKKPRINPPPSFSLGFDFNASLPKAKSLVDYRIVSTVSVSSDSDLMDRAPAIVHSFPSSLIQYPCPYGEQCENHTLSHLEQYTHPLTDCRFGEACQLQNVDVHKLRYLHPQETPVPLSPLSPDSPMMMSPMMMYSEVSRLFSDSPVSLELPLTSSTRKKQQPKKNGTQKNMNQSEKVRCPYCPKKLSPRGFVLKRHISTQHTAHVSSDQIKDFPCPKCKQIFKTKAACKRHYQIHSQEKPWKCDKCEKSYSDNVNLKRHAARHEGTTFQQKKLIKS